MEEEMRQKAEFAILGCGTLGMVVAQWLRSHDRTILLVDQNQERVSSLKEAGYQVVPGDIRDPEVLRRLPFRLMRGILILTSDPDINLSVCRMVSELVPDLPIIVRTGDAYERPEVEEPSPVSYFSIKEGFARFAIERLLSIERQSKGRLLRELLASIGSEGRLAIVLQETPDPDSIASGLALEQLAALYDLPADLLYAGSVGHQENRAMINLLQIRMLPYREEVLKEYTHLALVDTAIPGQNNPLPEDISVDIIIDHHKTNEAGARGRFIDIRPDIGATSTVMVEYIKECHMDLSPQTATALLYGIRTDTDEFRRNATPRDLAAASWLYTFADHAILRQIESPAKSNDTVNVLAEAIKRRQVRGNYLVSNVGAVSDKDSLAQAADYLITLEGITSVLVFGVTPDRILLSARNNDIRVNIGEMLEKAFKDVGSAGGHWTMAGGQISLGIFAGISNRGELERLVEQAIVDRFFKTLSGE